MNFQDLEIGDVFRTNCMIFQKIERKERSTNNDRRIVVNARFISDDHYESGRTDNYIRGSEVFMDDLRDVELYEKDIRAIKNEKVSV